MRAVLLIVLSGMTLSLSAAPAPGPKKTRREQPVFDGEWKLVWGQTQDGELSGMTMVIRGDEMTLVVSEDKRIDAYFTLGKGDPQTIDVRTLRVVLRGETIPCFSYRPRWLGICRIQGDRLTLSMGAKDRPADFAQRGSGIQFMDFQRAR